MGRMSELHAEKQEALNSLHQAYREAFEEMMAYQERHDISHRTLEQTNYLSKLTSICGAAKYKFDTAKMREWEREQV